MEKTLQKKIYAQFNKKILKLKINFQYGLLIKVRQLNGSERCNRDANQYLYLKRKRIDSLLAFSDVYLSLVCDGIMPLMG